MLREVNRWEVFVPGLVRPQGSMSLARDPRTGKEFAKYSDATVRWRQILHGAFSSWWGDRDSLRVPVGIEFVAWFERPKGHFGTGRNAGSLRHSAPDAHTVYPDLDKACRAIGDGLVDGGVLSDDSLVAEWWARKLWCPIGQKPGASVAVELL